MQSSNSHFKKKLLRLILFAVVTMGILVVLLLMLQKTVEKHYTTENESSPETIEVFKSPDEEYKFMEKVSNRSSVHSTTIPNDLIQ
ncbi:hypothetical protein [Sediminibacterium sp. KACHI17]